MYIYIYTEFSLSNRLQGLTPQQQVARPHFSQQVTGPLKREDPYPVARVYANMAHIRQSRPDSAIPQSYSSCSLIDRKPKPEPLDKHLVAIEPFPHGVV